MGSLTQFVTPAHRDRTYGRIFQGIPRSFLAPDHPHNRALIGALALGCAYVERQYRALEDGLFLDSATTDDAGLFDDGLSSLARWASWFDMSPLPGETAAQLRARIQSRLFAPRLTLSAIKTAVEAATGLPTRIEEPAKEIVRFNDGPFAYRKLAGDAYSYMRIDVITDAQTVDANEGRAANLPVLLNFLRAAGVHWRHLEITTAFLALPLETQRRKTFSSVQRWAELLDTGFRPNETLVPEAQPLVATPWRPSSLSITASVERYGGGVTYCISGAAGMPINTVLAVGVPAGAPALNWDDTTTFWEESVWANE